MAGRASTGWLSSLDGVTEVMNQTESNTARWGWLSASLVVPAALLLTGCQIDVAGQTLPSPYYLTDDVQYYAPGPGFKLAREAAAMKEQAAAEISDAQSEF